MKIKYKTPPRQDHKQEESIIDRHYPVSIKPDMRYKTCCGIDCDIFFIKVQEKRAFNASFISIKDKYIYAYRSDDFNLSACYLDRSYNVISDCFDLHLWGNIEPRVFSWRNELFLQTTFFNNWQDRTELWKIEAEDKNIRVIKRLSVFEHILDYKGYVKGREKNWTPLVKDDSLFFVYSINPHRVLLYNEEKNNVKLFANMGWNPQQKWLHGLRGNAKPFLLGQDYYISTFHNPDHSFGFYIFEAKYPFKVVKCSKFPIFIRKDGESITSEKLYYAPYLFFPTGLEVDEGLIKISSGINDIKTCIIHFDKNDILSSMTEV